MFTTRSATSLSSRTGEQPAFDRQTCSSPAKTEVEFSAGYTGREIVDQLKTRSRGPLR